jgi:hypothetical protein
MLVKKSRKKIVYFKKMQFGVVNGGYGLFFLEADAFYKISNEDSLPHSGGLNHGKALVCIGNST